MHQCGAGTNSAEANISAYARVKQLARRQNFRETALAVLDTQLRVLDWTWYLACPEVQVSAADSQWVSDGWTVPQGVAGPFRPPWVKCVYDARLLAVAGRLLITSTCRGCEGGIKWSQLQLTGDATTDGGLSGLRAWAARTFISDRRHGSKRWAAGRNQALFAVEQADGFEMLAQPWLGMIASFGPLQWVKTSVRCVRDLTRRTYPTLVKLLARTAPSSKVGGGSGGRAASRGPSIGRATTCVAPRHLAACCPWTPSDRESRTATSSTSSSSPTTRWTSSEARASVSPRPLCGQAGNKLTLIVKATFRAPPAAP